MKDLAKGIPVETLREETIEQLTSHFSLENLTMAEFEDRVIKANSVSNRAGLLLLLADLPDLPEKYYKKDVKTVSDESYSINTGNIRDSEEIICVFSGSDRKGVWRPARKINSICLFGGASLDLSEALIPPEGITINAVCIFGGIDVIVPMGVQVISRGGGVFGGWDNATRGDADSSGPPIIIQGAAIFGGVEIRHPKKRRR